MEANELERLSYNASILEEEGIPNPYGLFAEFEYYKRDEGDILARLTVTAIINVSNPKEAYRFNAPYRVQYVVDNEETNVNDYLMINETNIQNNLLELFSFEYDDDEKYNLEVKLFKERIKSIN